MIIAHTPPFSHVDPNDSFSETNTVGETFEKLTTLGELPLERIPSDYPDPRIYEEYASSSQAIATPTQQPTPTHKDWVNHPDHYNQGGIECIEAIKAACTGLDGYEGFLTGTALRYLWRWKHKENPVQDCNKAIWYINKLIEHENTKGVS